MSDFTYDSYDVSTMKTSLQNLRRAEQQGFWLGVLGGMPSGAWLVGRSVVQNKFKAGLWAKLTAGLMVGSLV